MKQLILGLLISVSGASVAQHTFKPKTGHWIGSLALSNQDELPFRLEIKKERGEYIYVVHNAEEAITLNSPVTRGDSTFLHFPYFESELVILHGSKKAMEGYWINHNRVDYRIPFSAVRSSGPLFTTESSAPKNAASVDGKWEVTFEPNTPSAYPAVGVFSTNEGGEVSGTFLTETGDYRYLAGNVVNDSLFLSCFDGSHAFLFKSSVDNARMSGEFFSGKHWQSEWNAERNENASLTNPELLTYLVEESAAVSFELSDINGNIFRFPEDAPKNKVTIIQIMGTWCPNCLDETMYYKDLYNRYHNRGLEIIAVGYEAGAGYEDQVESIVRYRDRLNLEYTLLVGGCATKQTASEHFDMLNEVISFPTSIFIGRDGKVKRIHTGFSGPGTGNYYQEYVENTNSLIESLLAE